MKEKIFRDPVHQQIPVSDQVIYDLINTPEFQRLRRIKQLGTTGFTFHGGEHSRFSHCLGVYELARQITNLFTDKYPDIWQVEDNLLTMVAALLHDIGHGAYSHTFEGLFGTDHEAFTQEIITNPQTNVHHILSKVAPDFPDKVASVINHSYPNKQVVQLISSQIDCDRMDYLLRDSYFTGVQYGQFDLARILSSIRPIKNGIAFTYGGYHAVEDYLLSRYQMYMQVYFHPASRAMEVLLKNLLKRAQHLYPKHVAFFEKESSRLIPFFENNYQLDDYLRLDDSVLNAYFQAWTESHDPILADLASRFINRKIFKSVTFSDASKANLGQLEKEIQAVGYEPTYYTAINTSFDLPYDIYRPDSANPRTQIDIIQANGHLLELSHQSPLVATLMGTFHGDQRFYFPKEMLLPDDLFRATKENFLAELEKM
ncbi:HD domain-containing protein [Streptococcus cuniculipharyngis]|uniref:HD domain-containing protein n=1 Tax=Streptococcus cuniculipharyngis TaxID=1562651 RepID=A0A5C5SGH5_9STRE|nr:HD domain-containing protein [Streptococcus cuniculipharyngis]TWS99055.1 HD domain-containing protein [Streptococcus cuniculipharyngis]